MHKYMRAIGFSKYADNTELKDILTSVITESDSHAYTFKEHTVIVGEFCKEFAGSLGITACGQFDKGQRFICEYFYPYLRGSGITTAEEVTVERHAAKESYAGVCDDINVGISLIFYLQNMIPYIKYEFFNQYPVKGTTLTLTALSVSGTVVMPLMKNERQKSKTKKESANRSNLLAAAKKGDENAIETLTLEDMDMYTTISRRIQKDDVFTLVDTYFMPYGVECDHYSVMGEIMGVRKTANEITSEELYILTICCNELTFDVGINSIDLFGEPQVGRRFKGIIWLQGHLNFPEEKVQQTE